MSFIEALGFKKILEFKQIPCEVYFHPAKAITLSIGKLENFCWLKASKHMFIKALERKGESTFYSKLQEITKFMEYLKHNLPEFHCVTYFISNITPKIAMLSFKDLPEVEKIMAEYDKLKSQLGSKEIDEEKLLKQLSLLKEAEMGVEAEVVKPLEEYLLDRQKLKEKLSKVEVRLKGAVDALNEWVEKGYAIALIWNFSTNIHICSKDGLVSEIEKVVDEIEMIEKQSVRARAYQQGIWIEEVKEPFYIYYAEAVGLFHPRVLQAYREHPLLRKFAEDVENWFAARLAIPIGQYGYKEDSSSVVAEALASFLRQVEVVEEIPKRMERRLSIEKINKPVYFGLIELKMKEEFTDTDFPFMIDLDELRKHCLITGVIGSGKTRIAQIIAETSSLYVPTIIIDPMGEFTGLIKKNEGMEREFKKFKLREGRAYDFAKIFTLDDTGIQFKANIIKNPRLEGDFLTSDADQTALILSELIGDERLRDLIREVLLDAWKDGRDVTYEEFVNALKEKAEKRRIGVKIDRLAQYKTLLSETGFSVDDLLNEKLVIFDLSSMAFTDTQKLMITWFILREILNYYLAQPHSDELRTLIIVDEVHRFYQPGMPKDASVVLENMVKQGRAKGLGVVMVSQSIKDLGETLTQANLRILLKILEAEVQSPYGVKFGLELARSLHGLDPKERIGYVFYSGDEFWCRFRPTLSMPKGVGSDEEIKKHVIREKVIESFNAQFEKLKTEVKAKEVKGEEEFSDDERKVIDALKNFEAKGQSVSKEGLRKALGFGREKINRIVNSLERKGKVEVVEMKNVKGHPKIVKLKR